MIRNSLFFLLVFGFGLSILPVAAEAVEYVYNQEKSEVFFTLKHLGIITVSGRFKEFSGSFHFDPKNIEATTVRIVIQTASVASDNAARDEHLRSEKFFDAKKSPEIRFFSKKIIVVSDRQFNIEGGLTIHGITQPVIFETELLIDSAESGAEQLSFHSHTFIKRKDFRLGTGGWMDPIMLVTNETLKISLEVKGIPSR